MYQKAGDILPWADCPRARRVVWFSNKSFINSEKVHHLEATWTYQRTLYYMFCRGIKYYFFFVFRYTNFTIKPESDKSMRKYVYD